MSKELIIKVAEEEGLTKPQIAYILATAYLETNRTFKPVREAYYLGNKAEAYRAGLRYYPYYGRGFVQLTWKDNYKRVGELLGRNFVDDPDQVMEPEVSAEILVKGMKYGWFSGKKLSDYINDEKKDYLNARRIVNIIDRAEKFKKEAERFEKELTENNMDFTSDLVKTHQQRLLDLGYYNLRVDGIAGTGTEEAFTRFKSVHGLRERPYPGPITCSTLWDDDVTHWEKVAVPETEGPPILKEAMKHLWVKEFAGSANNPIIMGWADDLDQWYPGDDVPWCGLFAAICAYRGAPNEPQNFNRLGARQWLKWGKEADGIPLGSIVVLWRTARNHWHGHVGIATGQNSQYVRLIGGNQSNEVNEKWFSKERILGVRVPMGTNYEQAPWASTGELSTTEQ